MFMLPANSHVEKINHNKVIYELFPAAENFTWSINLFELSEAIPSHYHLVQTQLIKILDGTMTLQLADQSIELRAGDFCAIPPKITHGLIPQEYVRFLVIDFPGFLFPEDVYEDNRIRDEGKFFICLSKQFKVDQQTQLNKDLLEQLNFLPELPQQAYLEKYSQGGYAAYTLVQNEKHWSIALLDINEVPLHYHKIETEQFIVLNGVLEITLDGTTYLLYPGQSVNIPPGIKHRVKSALAAPVRLLCINSPSFDPGDYHLSCLV